MSKALERLAEPATKNGSHLSEHEEAPPLHPVLQLQRMAGNQAVAHLLGSDDGDDGPGQTLTLRPAFGGIVQRKCKSCSATARCAACEEEEIHRKAKSSPSLSFTSRLQRKEKTSATLTSTAPHVQRAENDENQLEPEALPARALVVADDATTLASGQMRKSEFLEQLRSTVCTTADAALAEAGQSTAGCPYIEQWLSYYSEQEPAHIERALRKYAPEANSAATAADYIPAVSNRVREAVQRWARTGEVTGVPPELAGMLPGGGGVLGALAGIGSAIGGALSAAASAVGSAFSSIGRALFKRKESAAAEGDGEQQIQTQLSEGHPLDGSANSRMSAAFGHDFSNVRVHTGAQAAGLSDQLNARAFTIGSDIAFGAGEYQPGTMIGDALLAHELAHVVQQQGGEAAISSKGEESSTSLEEEADVAAEEVVISIWGTSVPGVPRARPQSKLRRQTGLSLQRCGGPSERELQTYLRILDAGAIEAGEKSHERARAISRAWSRGGSPYVLTATRKRMLLRELMHGAVSDDDREAMLELLERSYNFELSVMMRDTMAADLDAAFSGSMLQVWLRLFFNHRFEGGSDAVLGGTATPIHPDLISPFAPISVIRPQGLPRPVGEGLVGEAMEGGSQRWNVPCLLGILCEQDRTVVDLMRTTTDFRSVDHFEVDEWRFKDGRWDTWIRTNTAGINRSSENLIVMRTDRTCSEAASTLFHETHHQGQDVTVPWADREIEAYTTTEQWTIERGLPGRQELRMRDPVTGAVVPDPTAIEEHVRGYPGLATAGETVIGKTDDGQTRVRRDDGSEFTRAPVEGDRFRIRIRRIDEERIDPEQWVCPSTP